MESFKQFQVKNEDNEYTNIYSLNINNLCNAGIPKENEVKFDMLLDGILLNNKQFNNIKNKRADLN